MNAAEARFLLNANDTAIIEATAAKLMREGTVETMAWMCEAIASNDDDEVGETILWVLSSAWKSGEIPEVPHLFEAVAAQRSGDARRGAGEALEWFGLRP